tara:strand:- start:2388 stop:3314 length:927 start_codon:yes stop_codon:yes gene_type:complete
MSKNGIYTPLDFKNVDFNVSIDEVGVGDRLARIKSRSIKKASKVEATLMAINMIDLTTLEGMDSPAKVRQLCSKAMRPHEEYENIPSTAAVCVYPNYVALAKKELKGSGVNVAAVSTAFPSGNAPMSIKIEDTKFAVDAGADEIDMVISRGKFLCGEYNFVFDEIAKIKEVCGKAHLKVILETGELETLDKVRLASDIAMEAGADFIKTSTGKIQPAATMPVTLVMLEAIREFYYRTGKMIGMKPAGGIKQHKDALKYLVMVKETLGEAWLNNKYFRFGASSLANELLMQLVKEYTGNYQAPEYFSID